MDIISAKAILEVKKGDKGTMKGMFVHIGRLIRKRTVPDCLTIWSDKILSKHNPLLQKVWSRNPKLREHRAYSGSIGRV